MISASRTHEFCAGHRVVGHEGKCAHIHGHGYVATFVCTAEELDEVGRVLDFSEIKNKLCQWLEDEWDHRLLIYSLDPNLMALMKIDDHVVSVPFNPTAENMAEYLLKIIGPIQLEGTGVKLVAVTIQETGKCSAKAEL